jgi:hypothetical protein
VENSHCGFGFGEKNNIYKRDEQEPGPGTFDPAPTLWKSKTCENWSFGKGSRSN